MGVSHDAPENTKIGGASPAHSPPIQLLPTPGRNLVGWAGAQIQYSPLSEINELLACKPLAVPRVGETLRARWWPSSGLRSRLCFRTGLSSAVSPSSCACLRRPMLTSRSYSFGSTVARWACQDDGGLCS